MVFYERAFIWLGHVSMVVAGSTLFFTDQLPNSYIGSGIFMGGVCSYTIGTAISLYLDRTIPARQIKSTEDPTLGRVIKPILLVCLCTAITLGLIVLAISEYAKTLGVL